MDENVLNVKVQDSEKKIDRKFKLPHNSLIQKIQSKFDVSKEENTQTLLINIPKEVFKKSWREDFTISCWYLPIAKYYQVIFYEYYLFIVYKHFGRET